MTIILGADAFGDWPVLEEFCVKRPERFIEFLDRALSTEAHHIAGAIRRRIAAGKFLPLARRRPQDGSLGSRGTKPLNKTGGLKNSVTAIPEQPNGSLDYFAGVPYRSGNVSIARVHEYGSTFVVIVTKKMLRFLFAVVLKRNKRKGHGKQTGTLRVGYPLVITIPARPFVGPTLTAELPGSIGRIADSMNHHLGVYLGALKRARARRALKSG